MSAVRQRLLRPATPVLLAFLAAAIVILLTGGEPIPAFAALLKGAIGDPSVFFENLVKNHEFRVPKEILTSLAKATPLLFSGLAVAVALRAGLFNIGAEGQIVMGGMAAAWAGFAIKGLPMIIHLPLALIVGAAAGMAWGSVPGMLKAWRGTHEVIVTIMMNYIAFELAHYLINHTIIDPSPMTNPNHSPKSPDILPTARLWAMQDFPAWSQRYSSSNFSAGFLLAILAALAVAFLIRRTALGYEIRAVGLGADAARTAGISVGRTQIMAMAISGGLAGLAGAVEVLAVHHRFYESFSPGYGFDSIAVALMGGLNSMGVLLSSVLFGALNAGKLMMERQTGVPAQIAVVIQAVIIIAVGARYLRRKAE